MTRRTSLQLSIMQQSRQGYEAVNTTDAATATPSASPSSQGDLQEVKHAEPTNNAAKVANEADETEDAVLVNKVVENGIETHAERYEAGPSFLPCNQNNTEHTPKKDLDTAASPNTDNQDSTESPATSNEDLEAGRSNEIDSDILVSTV